MRPGEPLRGAAEGSAYEIRHVEVGFLASDPRPADPLMAAMRWVWVHVPGLPVSPVQFWRLDVRGLGTDPREHLVVMSHHPPRSAETRAAIASLVRTLYPQATLSFTVEDADGRAVIDAEAHAAEAAAAIAEVKRSGAWDESPVFRVVAGAQAFAVTVRWRKDRAEAHVTEEAGAGG